MSDPRIYVADLSAYNSGILRGRWICTHQTPEDIQQEIDDMLSESGAEEWEIHDFEGFGPVDVTDLPLNEIQYIAVGISEYGAPYALYVDNTGDDSYEGFEDSFRGIYDSIDDYAYELANEIIPGLSDDSLASHYFDYESFARDLVLGGDVWTADLPTGEVAVFSS